MLQEWLEWLQQECCCRSAAAGVAAGVAAAGVAGATGVAAGVAEAVAYEARRVTFRAWYDGLVAEGRSRGERYPELHIDLVFTQEQVVFLID